MARASDFTDKAICTMRTCELEMSHQNLHRSNQPRRGGPGSKWTKGEHEKQDEADELEKLRRVLAARQPDRAGEAEAFSDKSCSVCTLVRSACESKRNKENNRGDR